MSRATVEDEIIQEAGEEGNNSGSHIEPNVINPGGESGHAPAGAESGSTPGQSRSGSRHRQPEPQPMKKFKPAATITFY